MAQHAVDAPQHLDAIIVVTVSGKGLLVMIRMVGVERVLFKRRSPGLAPTCLNTVDRERISSAYGYMDDQTRARQNLTLLAETEVAKVLFTDAGRSESRLCELG